MSERVVRCIAFALAGFVGCIGVMIAMLLVDFGLTALGTPAIVERFLTPAIVISVVLFLYGYFGRDE